MVGRLLRVTGLLAVLWLLLVTLARVTAPPSRAVSYLTTTGVGPYALDLRLNVRARLLTVGTHQRVMGYNWEPGGRLALFVFGMDHNEVWVRSPDGALMTVRTPIQSADVNWSPTGDAVIMIHGDALTRLDPTTGAAHRQPLAAPLYTLRNVFIPLAADAALVQGRRASGELPFYYTLNLQSGDSVQANDLPCGGAPASITAAGDDALLYTCQRANVLYLRVGETVQSLVTTEQLGQPGEISRARLSPDGTQVLFAYRDPSRTTFPPFPRYYVLNRTDGSIRPIVSRMFLANARWIPQEALQHER